MIKAILLVAVVIGSAAIPVYNFMQPPDYGVSPMHPLGEYQKIEDWVLRWDHYSRTAGQVSEAQAFDYDEQFGGLQRIDYAWKDMRENGYPRTVTVILDGADRVQAIQAEFPSKTQEPREPLLTSEELLWRMWTEIAGRDPRFVRVKGDEGVQHIDSFTARGIKGTWTKNYKVPNSERSICDTVRIFRVLE